MNAQEHTLTPWQSEQLRQKIGRKITSDFTVELLACLPQIMSVVRAERIDGRLAAERIPAIVDELKRIGKCAYHLAAELEDGK